MLHVLELGARRREQFLGRLDVPVHRAADVEEQQHLHRIVPLRPHLDVEIALVRGALDGAVEIEFVGRAGAGEFAQAAQRDLDVAGAEFDVVVEILELALVPDLHRAAGACSRRRCGCLPDCSRTLPNGEVPPVPIHFAAALVAALLLGEALLQRLQQLVEAAHRLDLLLLFLGEIFVGELLQPLGRNFGRRAPSLQQLEALEHVAEHAVELVEVALVLHQRGARQIIEILDAAAGEVGLHRLHQRQIFAQRHRHAGGLQLVEEGDEHRVNVRVAVQRSGP